MSLILLDGHTLGHRERFTPESMSLNLVEPGVSTASFTVGPEAPEIRLDSWLLDGDGPGAGIVWRVKGVDEDRFTRTRTVQLEHVIATLKDVLLFGEMTTKDLGGNKNTVTAAKAIRTVLARQDVWTLWHMDFAVSMPYSFNNNTAYQALESICQTLDGWRWEYDLTRLPFRLSIVRRTDEVGCELRMTRNLSSLRYSVDRSNMYTRFYPVGARNLHITGDYVSKNEALYGVVSHTETDQSLGKEPLLRAWAEDRLSRHAEPLVTVTISALDLSASTGEPLDRIKLGMICRVPLPMYDTVITERVTRMSWQDKIKEPERVSVTLANQPTDVANLIKQLSSSGSRNSGGGALAAEEDHAWIEDTADHVALVAEAIIGRDGESVDWSRVSSIIVDGEGIHQRVVKTQDDLVVAESKIEVNEKEIRLEVHNREKADETLSSRITQTADKIALEVARATAAEGTLSGRITVEADRITSEVTRATDAEGTLSGRITVTESAITSEVTRATAAEGTLSGRITVEADRITSEVTRATEAEGTLSGRITVTEGAITSEVTRATAAEGTLSGRITVTESAITNEVTRATEAEGTLSGRITVTESAITSEVIRATSAEETLSGRVTITESAITSEVTRATEAEGTLSGRLTVTEGAVSAEVTRASNAESALSGRINVNADKVSLVVAETQSGYEVDSASIVAGINGQSGSYVKIRAATIDLDGYVTASQLTAQSARIDNLISGQTTMSLCNTQAIRLSGRSFYLGTITVAGTSYNVVRWGSGD